MTYTWTVRQFIWDRDQGICGLCSEPIESIAQMEVDHIVARFKGGANDCDNYRAAHISCNRSRGAQDGLSVRLANLARRPKMKRTVVHLDATALSAGAYLAQSLGNVGLSAAIRFALFQTAKRKGWKAESVDPRRRPAASAAAEEA